MTARGMTTNPINPGENLRSDNLTFRLIADGAIAKGAFVELVTNGHVKQADATVGGYIGVALEAAAASGDEIRVATTGAVSVMCDATGCKLNDFVKPDANGKATVATYGTDTCVGIAVGDGGAGEAVAVLLIGGAVAGGA